MNLERRWMSCLKSSVTCPMRRLLMSLIAISRIIKERQMRIKTLKK